MEKSRQKSYLKRWLKLQLKRNYAIVIAAAALAAVYFYALRVEPALLRVTELEFSSPDVPPELDSLRIAFTADMHITRHTAARVPEIVRTINQLQCDLILLGGDFINGNGNGPDMAQLMPQMQKLHAPQGVYAIAGNHEYRRGMEKFRTALKNSHLKLLVDETAVITLPNGGKFTLIGLDYSENPHRRSDQKRLKDLLSTDTFNMVLSHTPEDFPFLPENAHLVFSGHTHGGQLYLPGIGSVINPPGYGRKFSYGKVCENNKTVFITAGIGSAYTQARLFMKPEIMVITLKSLPKK